MPIHAGPPELPEGHLYRARTSALEAPRVYRIRSGQFSVLDEKSGKRQTFPLGDFVELRLRYQPTRVQLNRYECILKNRTGQSFKICNEYFAGVMDFRDQSREYSTWVRHLVREIGFHAPQCKLITGTSNIAWWGYLLMLTVVFGTLFTLLIFLAAAASPIAIAKLIIIAFMTPAAIGWFKKNKRKSFTAAAIPENLLP